MIQKNQFENCPEGLPSATPRGRIIGLLRRRPQAGFTLIEILMAMTIFSTSFLALAAGATTVMKSNKSSFNDTFATTLAQDVLEQLMALSPAAVTACTSNCDSPKPKSNGVEFTRTWTINDTFLTGVRKVDVLVEWNDHINHTLTVSSIVDL